MVTSLFIASIEAVQRLEKSCKIGAACSGPYPANPVSKTDQNQSLNNTWNDRTFRNRILFLSSFSHSQKTNQISEMLIQLILHKFIRTGQQMLLQNLTFSHTSWTLLHIP